MSSTSTELSSSLDLSKCASEPIHIPGAIQPHGVLFVLDAAQLTVSWVSGNLERLFGLSPSDVLGRHISAVTGVGGWSELVATMGSEHVSQRGSLELRLASGAKFTAVAFRHEGRLLLECEPDSSDSSFEHVFLYERVRSLLARLRETATVEELCAETAQELGALTGIDRVMVYKFHDDWSGEAVAEASARGPVRYLGLRFPASDIPQQARALYTSCRLRVIASSLYEPAPLVGGSAGDTVDLTHAVLRSVSPVHLQYMRNMGVTASMGISLMQDGKLWGLITCNHESGERFIPHRARTACALIGEIVSSLIADKQRLQESENRAAFLRVQAQLLQFIAHDRDVSQGMTQHTPSLLDVTASTGAMLCYQQRIHGIGETPAPAAIEPLLRWLEQRAEQPLVFDSLPTHYPPALAWKNVGCGLLATRVDFSKSSLVKQQTWLLWFRPEVAQTVSWGGDPNKSVAVSAPSEPLRPRASFELWKEDVHLKSVAFRAEDVAAARALAVALTDVIIDIEVSRKMREDAELLAQVNAHLLQQIAERERVEVELRRAQKLEAVGRLAAGIAHEINTPLQFMSDNVAFLKDATSKVIAFAHSSNPSPAARTAARFDYLERQIPKALESSVKGLERVSAIVKAMKEFAQPDGDEKSLGDLNRALAVTLEVAQSQLEQVATVELDLGTLPLFPCYVADLNQAFLSLLVNAANAIERTLGATRARGSISVKSWYAAPDVWISITDDGAGIPEAIRESVFLPFFTTKQVGQGTGQSLAIAHAIIVGKHAGSLSFESTVGCGTTFTIRLPAHDAVPA